MDPRRLLTLACAGLGLSSCALLPDLLATTPPGAEGAPWADAVPPGARTEEGGEASEAAPPAASVPAVLAAPLEPTPDEQILDRSEPGTARGLTGRPAITAANLEARSASRSDGFVGGVQVFAWSPGRVYEVWTAPLRVTTLTLGPGESLVAKAAGDTVRWQIGETSSGEGASRRHHVLIKPLERGLETNLVLTTNRRVYLLNLMSGDVEGFNAAVAWDADGLAAPSPAPLVDREPVRVPDPVVTPEGPLDARYAIEPRGRRPIWSPTAVFNDGRQTFIAFAADLQTDEAPALFILAPDGEAQMVNYRQAGGLFIVDRVFDRAELRLGDRRPQIVRIRRLRGDAR